jgi:OTU-like cysteine protease
VCVGNGDLLFDKLFDFLRPYEFDVAFNPPPDGACQFDAIAHQLSISTRGRVKEDSASLRMKVVRYLTDNERNLQAFMTGSSSWQNYVKKMSAHDTYGDHITLVAASKLYSVQILVVSSLGLDATTVISPESNEHRSINPQLPLIFVAHSAEQHGEHYVSISPSNDCALQKFLLAWSTSSSGEQKAMTTVVSITDEHNHDNAAQELPCNDNKSSTDASNEPTDTSTDWPSVWSESVWNEKKQLYPFLFSSNGKLGCKSCKHVGSLSTWKTQGLHLSAEWVKCSITAQGKGRHEMLRSLRKKMSTHVSSTAHRIAQEIMQQAEKGGMDKVLQSMNSDAIEMSCKVFRTAYYLARNDRPFSDHQSLLELQQANGLDVGIGLKSRYSATEIVQHVYDTMRKTACSAIIQCKGKIAVLVDESTTVSNQSALIVYLKCETDKSAEPHYMFLQLVELPDQKADTIARALIDCLRENGFDNEYLQQHLVAFVSDGASVMTGRKAGVASILRGMFPNLITYHCLNHRLELAVGDCISDCVGVNHFRSFMDSLYSLYSQSPKTQRQLEEVADDLGVRLRKIGRVLNTRWVASSFLTVAAVWNNFEALAGHFQSAACTQSPHFDKSLQPKYSGLMKKLCSPQFVKDLGLMYDSLEELKLLSESLQKRDVTLPVADKLIRRIIRRIERMKETSGPKMREAQGAADAGKYGSTLLTSNGRHVPIHAGQFLTSLANNMRSRLLDGSTSSFKDPYAVSAKKLIDWLTVLDPEYWPNAMDESYGDDEVRFLCSQLKVPYDACKLLS